MSHTPEYEKLLADLNAGELPLIVRKILEALLQAPKGLIRIVFGEKPGNHPSNDTRDRKIRKGIELLRCPGYPIVSTSGKAGCKLDTDPKEYRVHDPGVGKPYRSFSAKSRCRPALPRSVHQTLPYAVK